MPRIHWAAPTALLLSLVVGTAFAIGHHVFYASLNHRPASDSVDYDVLGMHVSSQQFNTAIGTAFAFMVRACLMFSVSVAYFQILMWAVARPGADGIELSHLDILTSALGDLISLGSLKAWWRRPWIWLLVVVAWMIPLASIVTPATLSVGFRFPPSRLMNVPAVDFSSLNLVAPMTQYGTSGGGPDAGYSYMYGGPSLAVQRITDSVAAQGSIATVATTPAVNSSWEIDFEGPSLHCNPVSSDFRRNALDNILNYTLGRSRGPGGDNCNYGPGYVAWHPSSMSLNDSVRELLPFYISTSTRNESTYTLNNAEGYSYPYTDLASLFLAVTPTLMEKTRADGWTPPRMCRGNSWYDAALADYHEVSTVLRCDVHNSTYHAAFSFVNGVQSIEVDATEVTRTPMTVLTDALAYFGTTNGSSQGSQPRACPDSGITPDGVFADACVLDPTVMSTLSYQAVMHAFSSLLTGSISIGDREDLITAVTSTTRLSSTVLARSPELAFLQDGMSQSLGAIQQTAPSFQAPFAGLVNGAVTQKSALPLQQALEQVFQNITFSLMSAAELQPNRSSQYYPAQTEVHFQTRDNVFVFAAEKLWLAYGLAVGATALIALFGIVAIFANHASYSDRFSTFLRLSRGAQLSSEIEGAGLSGQDPLPAHARQTIVTFPGQRSGKIGDANEYKPVDREDNNDSTDFR